MKRVYFLMALLALNCCFPVALADKDFYHQLRQRPYSAAELKSLRTGEVLVSEREQTSGTRFVLAKILIEQPAEEVWAAIQDQKELFRGEPHMKKVRTLAKMPSRQDVAYSLKISRFLPTFDYQTRIQFDRSTWTARFNRTRGSFKAFKGFSVLKPVDNNKRTVLLYGLQIDPGFFVPQFVVRSVLKSELPELLGKLRERMQAKG